MGEIHRNGTLCSISFQSFILLLLNEKNLAWGRALYINGPDRLTGRRELIHTGLAAHNSNSVKS